MTEQKKTLIIDEQLEQKEKRKMLKRVISTFHKVLTPEQMKERKPKIQRNATCYCGSGLKYKKCHGKSEA